MRVKISYTVDLEEMPERVDALVDEATRELQKGLESGREEFNHLLMKHGNLEKSIKRVDEMREALLKADLQLSDCTQLLVKLQGLRAQLNEPDNEQPQAEEDLNE